MKSSWLWIGSSLLLAACVHRGFISTSNLKLPPRPKNCNLEILLDGTPTKPHTVIGRVTTDSTAPGLFALGETQEAVLNRLKEEACLAGAQVIFKIVSGSEGQWNKDGYSRSTQGSAVAAVYVDENGNPLPNPSDPEGTKVPATAKQQYDVSG